MSANHRIYVELVADVSGLQNGMRKASADVSSLDKGLSKLKAGGLLALTTGVALVANETLKLDTAMRNVNSISGMTEGALKATSAALVDMSKTLPQSASTLAEGLYDIASSGFQGADGMKVLTASAVAASAGMTDTAVAAQAITAVLNAYGKDASEAADVSDVLFSTVNLGVTTFEQLANSLGDFVGPAQALGVQFDETGSAIATMTLQGITAASAGTTLGSVLNALIKPGEGMAQMLEKAGYASGSAAVEALGLSGTMDLVRKASGGTAEGMSLLFNDTVALRGALALVANEGKTYGNVASTIEDRSKRAGAAQEALTEQSKAAAFQLTLIRNNAMAAGVSLANMALPGVIDGLREIQKVGGEAGEVIGRIGQLFGPALSDLQDIGVDLIDLFIAVAEATAPLVHLLGSAVVGGLVLGLEALTTVLGPLVGFLSDSEFAAAAFALALTVSLIPAATRAAAVLYGQLAMGLYKSAQAMYALRTGALMTSTAMTALLSPLGLMLAAVAATTIGVNYLVNKLAEPVPALDRMSLAFQRFATDGQITGAMLGVVGEDFEDLGRKIDQAGQNKWLSFREGSVEIQSARNEIEGLDQQLTELVNTDRAAEAQQMWEAMTKGLNPGQVEALKEQLDGYRGAVVANAEAAEAAAASEEAQAAALQKVQNTAGLGFGVMEDYADALGLAEDATKALIETSKAYVDAYASFVSPMDAYTGSLQEQQEAEQAWAQGVADSTSNSKDSWEDHARAVSVSVDEYLAELEKMVTDQENWAVNMTKLSSRVSADTLTELAKLGPEAAPLIAEFVNASESQLVDLEDMFSRRGAASVSAFGAGMVQEGPILTAVAGMHGQAAADKLAEALRAGKTTIAQIAMQYGISVTGAVIPAAATAGRALNAVGDNLTGLGQMRAMPKVEVLGASAATAAVNKLQTEIAELRDRTVRVNVVQNGQVTGVHVSGAGGSGTIMKADGGYISGAGGPTDDLIPAMLSDGEYVIRAAAVQRLGVPTLDRLNAMANTSAMTQIAGFASGGAVGRSLPMLPANPAPLGLVPTATEVSTAAQVRALVGSW